MKSAARHHAAWPFLAALALFALCMGAIVAMSLGANDGLLVYPLDDTYIHMSMAKTFAGHGVWGITQHGFSSSTSSPLWTLLISAGFLVFGNQVLLPLLLSASLGMASLYVAYRIIRRDSSALTTFVLLLVFVAITPLVAMSMLGMEHILHILLTLLLVDISTRLITAPQPGRRQELALVAISIALPMVRLEGAFTLLAVGLLLIRSHRLGLTALMALGACLPLALYGLLSHLQGWEPLPNSILLKATIPSADSLEAIINALGGRGIVELFGTRELRALIAAAAVGVLLHPTTGQKLRRQRLVVIVFVASTLLHLQFSLTGWFFRYEAYLMALGFVAALPLVPLLARATTNTLKTNLVLVTVLVIAFPPLANRTSRALLRTPRAMNDRYLEHVQPARFVTEYYADSTIVVNDIGIMAYYSPARILDMFGLGSLEPLKFRRQDSGYGPDDLQAWAASMDAEIAILQIEWPEVTDRIPEKWVKVSNWRVPRNVVFHDHNVGFFATSAEHARTLRERIDEHAQSVPREVVITFP